MDKSLINGEKASLVPDFSLPDTEGQRVCLSDYRGRQPVVLVFNRGFA